MTYIKRRGKVCVKCRLTLEGKLVELFNKFKFKDCSK
jgi:hypothetical protein